MQKIYVLALACMVSSVTYSQSSITAAEAAKHIGEKATVCDKVYGGRYLDNANGKPTLINLGAAYPNNPFTFVIFGDDRKKFNYQPETFLVDKEVCVTGEIKEFRGKPQIAVADTTQVVIKK